MGIRFGFIIVALLATPLARAMDFCVQDDSQFATALSVQEITPGTHTIRLGANRTFHLAGTAFDDASNPYHAEGITIVGGYNADCSAQTTRDAASSVLDGSGTGSGLSVLSVAGGSSLTLRNLTLANFAKPLSIDIGGDDVRLRWQHVRVIDSASIEIAMNTDGNARFEISNSLFARMSGAVFNAALSLSGFNDGMRIDLLNTTITASASKGVSILNPNGSTYLYNNIFHGNASGYVDLDLHEPVYAFNNTVGTHSGTYLPGSADNSSANPLFVSASDYNLQFASPARDSGTQNTPVPLSAFDIQGGVRVAGGQIDRGAYENDASGGTIVQVSNTNDAGIGSLRQAILDANANPAFNIIGFNIPGTCPRTIALDTELPSITDAVSIRGYSQPGSRQNSSLLIDNATICVELVEASGHTVINGLRFRPATDQDSLDVSGLAIGGFNRGIFIDHVETDNGAGYSIWGNFIGLAADGSSARANSYAGVDVSGRSYGTIGGNDDAQRNVIAGGLAGVRIDADQSNFIVNNFIGTSSSGGVARPNAIGVYLLTPFHQVSDNVISGNSAAGISISADSNNVSHNRIGLKAFAFCPPPCTPDYALGNGGAGVQVRDTASDNQLRDNTIAWNTGAGVGITSTGAGNSIRENRIHDNDGLGIDLGVAGVDPIDNDPTTPAGTPNHGLNAPELAFSRGGNTSGHVLGQLQTINGQYRIELYASPTCDASGHGEGSELVGSGIATIGNATATTNGSTTFDLAIADTTSLVGREITALAVAQDAWPRLGDTSEFSACVAHQFVDIIFADGFDPAIP